MPIITFTPADRMAAVTCEAGWVTAIITKIDGPRASGSGKSLNMFIEFKVQGGKYEGKELKLALSSGSSSASILGDSLWAPTNWLIMIAAAVLGVPQAQVPDQLDTDTIMNKPLDVKVEVSTSDGGLINTVSQFAPAGTSVKQKAPF